MFKIVFLALCAALVIPLVNEINAQSSIDGAMRFGVGYISTDLADALNGQWSLEPMLGPVLFSFSVLNAGLYTDGKSRRLFHGASIDTKVDLSGRNRAFFIGAGYRMGIGRSPYLAVSVGPAPKVFPLYLDVTVGTEHISVVSSWRVWARR